MSMYSPPVYSSIVADPADDDDFTYQPSPPAGSAPPVSSSIPADPTDVDWRWLRWLCDYYDQSLPANLYAARPPQVVNVDPTSGALAGGDRVTVWGSGLAGATAVTFGGVAATAVTPVSDRDVQCTTPAHAAGTVDVAVTTPDGTATGTGVFTYAALETREQMTDTPTPEPQPEPQPDPNAPSQPDPAPEQPPA